MHPALPIHIVYTIQFLRRIDYVSINMSTHEINGIEIDIYLAKRSKPGVDVSVHIYLHTIVFYMWTRSNAIETSEVLCTYRRNADHNQNGLDDS